jgi:hypothetical protein
MCCGTPQSFFDQLNAEFGFHSRSVRVRAKYKVLREWDRKCYEASRAGALVVLLAHARTDTRWFHDWVYRKADEIRFVRGQLKFGDGKQSAPFPSMVAIYLPRYSS